MLDSLLMSLAVEQARRGGPATYQNPQVGAILVKDDRVLATGYHHAFGAAHAEVDCLDKVTPRLARGATLIVTLEPCVHFGKTPPCCRRIVASGISRVVIGQLDPHPIVAGRGRDYLRQHGLEVTVGVAIEQVERLNRHYNWFYRQKRPWVTLKAAQTLDGKINAVASRRTHLTGTASWLDSQRLRANFQAILVGERTLTTDDPQLTVRTQALRQPPVRLVLLNSSTVAVGKRIVEDDGVPTWLLCRHRASSDADLGALPNVHVVIGEWPPTAISQFCVDHGWQSLLVEGGSHVQAQFVTANLIDEWVAYIAPMIMGGAALPAVADPTNATTTIQFERPTVRVLGTDFRVQAYRKGVR